MFDLKMKPNRSPALLAHESIVVASYTLDHRYVTSYELAGIPTQTAKILPLGYVVGYDPTTGKVTPNYTTYESDPLGVLIHDAFCGFEGNHHDAVVSVLWRGDVFEDAVWDNGDYDVLEETKEALSDRIRFVKETGGARF